jgi:hypothetical protein
MPAPSPETGRELARVLALADPPSMRPRPPTIWVRVMTTLHGTGGRWVRAGEVAAAVGLDVRQVAAALGGLALLGRIERREGRRGPAFRLPRTAGP